MKKKLAYIATALLFPLVASAQGITQVTAQQITSLQTLVSWLIYGINHIAVPFVFSAAFLVFIWGVFEAWILGKGDEEKRQQGRDLVIWGVAGFFVMLTIWGLVNVAVNTFNLNNAAPSYPTAPYTP